MSNAPFRRPQTSDYIRRVIKISIEYVSMIFRSLTNKVANFPVPLSDAQVLACRNLQNAANQGLDLLQPTHHLCWSLLATNPSEMMDNDRLCPIRRFLIAHFLQENGSFTPVQYMTTDFSKLLVFFRCIACYHLIENAPSHERKYFG
jgi:hypothetical protein